MRYQITRLSAGEIVSSHPLRTTSVVGNAKKEPEIGRPFILIADPIVEGTDGRAIITSPVVTISDDVMTTETGSRYWIQKVNEG